MRVWQVIGIVVVALHPAWSVSAPAEPNPPAAASPAASASATQRELVRLQDKAGTWYFGEVLESGPSRTRFHDLRSGREITFKSDELASTPEPLADSESTAALGLSATLAWKIRGSLTETGPADAAKAKIAVIPPVDATGVNTRTGVELAEELTTGLTKAGIPVIERAQLGAILKELNFQQSERVDPATAQRVGKQLGAYAVVVGSISLGNQRYAQAQLRAVKVETGEVLTALTYRLPRRDLTASTPAAPANALPSAPKGRLVIAWRNKSYWAVRIQDELYILEGVGQGRGETAKARAKMQNRGWVGRSLPAPNGSWIIEANGQLMQWSGGTERGAFNVELWHKAGQYGSSPPDVVGVAKPMAD